MTIEPTPETSSRTSPRKPGRWAPARLLRGGRRYFLPWLSLRRWRVRLLLVGAALFAGLFATEDQKTGMASFVANGVGKAEFRGR